MFAQLSIKAENPYHNLLEARVAALLLFKQSKMQRLFIDWHKLHR